MDLTEEQIAEFKIAFKGFDKNGDGNISSADLSSALRSLNYKVNEQEVTAWIAAIDTKNKGSVDIEAFLAMASRHLRDHQAEEEVKEAFRVFDRDHNGFITHDELKIAMQTFGDALTDEEVAELIKECDVDGDGQLNYEEFAKMMHEKL